MARVTTKQALDPPAPAKRPRNRKAQIALAAAELFCERGYHGVGIDEIAESVGITGPAVYRHFPNKYAMLVHATRELTDALWEATGGYRPGATPDERLDEILTGLARVAVERRRVGGVYQWEGRYLDAADRARQRADLRILVERITTPLAALRPELTGESGRLIACGVLSLMGSLSTHRAAIGRSRAVELLRDSGWRLLRADLRSAGASGAAAGPAATEPRLRSRRETIMAEALRLFHARGYHAVSMEEIAGACGTKASSLYRHFPSKSDLLAAVYHRAADRVAATTSAALASAADLDDALARLVDSYVDLVFGLSDLVTVYQAENTNLPERDRHELRRAQRLHVEEWVRIVNGLRPELSTAEARILAHAALNLISDLGRHLRFSRAAGLDRVVAGLALTVLPPVQE
jgi:AcrR family transcriptional regulator